MYRAFVEGKTSTQFTWKFDYMRDYMFCFILMLVLMVGYFRFECVSYRCHSGTEHWSSRVCGNFSSRPPRPQRNLLSQVDKFEDVQQGVLTRVSFMVIPAVPYTMWEPFLLLHLMGSRICHHEKDEDPFYLFYWSWGHEPLSTLVNLLIAFEPLRLTAAEEQLQLCLLLPVLQS